LYNKNTARNCSSFCLFPEKINGDYVRLDRPYGLAIGSLSELLSELKKNPPELLDAYKK
jgi:hypothetical protein